MEQMKNEESIMPRSRYAKEKYFNALITNGEPEKLEQVLSQAQSRQVGQTSPNPYRQQLYDCIIGISMAARAAMEGGMNEEDAYQLGDAYIREADAKSLPEQLWKLYNRMVIDFAEHVRDSKAEFMLPDAVRVAIDYIVHHLHCELTLKEIADCAGLSETYFSALFKKETGDTVSVFIQKSRVKEAKQMLTYSDYTLFEIAQYLGFCSQSHFSKTFRKYTNTTPGEYRRQHYRRTW